MLIFLYRSKNEGGRMETAHIPNILMSQEEMVMTRILTDAVNKQVNNGKTNKNELDKDAFLKLLITQLANQDPMQPMEDKEFIAQMAQFSTLEQINNMSIGFERLGRGLENLSHLIEGNNALALLGKVVEIAAGEEIVTGKVEIVSGGETQQIFVGGRYYDYQAVISISSEGA
jgi:flagellar basal-body rod modification protein FlgD